MRKQTGPTRLVLATSNKGKVREVRRLLKGCGLALQSLPATPLFAGAPLEDGRTFAENACKKASHYARALKAHVFSEDSGLRVRALGGMPGVRSARFLGPSASDDEKCRAVLDRLKCIPTGTARAATFVAAGAIADPQGRILFVATARCAGRIAFDPKGRSGFGYDPIFYYHPSRKTFAEMSSDEKNRVSHRGRLLAKVILFLGRRFPREGRFRGRPLGRA
ncbi:MAG: RdgB/HAM1 family non-canonical purine NTP pyrophosphatase [Acidobacteria bacterium]|nr:RdgB/HAM1 family non-canonical purine NTP pyrophosphatase [Acidobacteriota bacterium]